MRREFRVSQAYSDMISTKDYLPEWNVRSKWNQDVVRQLKVNDLVWVVEESVMRCNYKMARVLEVQEGSDSRVISATVVTKDGKLKRPVVKLAPCSMKVFFSGKKRSSIVGASQLQDAKQKFECDC